MHGFEATSPAGRCRLWAFSAREWFLGQKGIEKTVWSGAKLAEGLASIIYLSQKGDLQQQLVACIAGGAIGWRNRKRSRGGWLA